MTRRIFLADLGKFTLGVSLLGVAACGGGEQADSTAGSSTTTPANASPSTTSTTAGVEPESTTTDTSPPDEVFSWQRVDLGNVSAVVLAKAREAVLVDTGNPGDQGSIEATLAAMGLTWMNLGHVVVTHRHGDHQGSLEAVMTAASDASAYCGAGDLEAIRSPRPLTVVGNGDQVLGLDIIETPGHTPGHICVLDSVGGVLIAGDALNGAGSGVEGSDGGVGGANPRFTSDMVLAAQSIRSLAGLSFDVAIFGHGAPLEGGASDAVAALAESL